MIAMTSSRPSFALLALTAGAFGIGVTEFVIVGLPVGADLHVSTSAAELLISGYARGVVVGAPFPTVWAVGIVGIVALALIAPAVPADREASEPVDWRRDLRALGQHPMLLGLTTTLFGYAGGFAVFTYIAPLPIERSGFSVAAISPIPLLFGGELVLTMFASLLVLLATADCPKELIA